MGLAAGCDRRRRLPAISSPPSYYDVTGNGLVNALDTAAVQNILSGQAITWQRPGNRFDTSVTPADALVIINALSATGERIVTGSPGPNDNFLDVSGDGVLSVVDANQVIDYLNGGDGTAGAPWRNPSQALDGNNRHNHDRRVCNSRLPHERDRRR